jgi:hypothetical protein
LHKRQKTRTSGRLRQQGSNKFAEKCPKRCICSTSTCFNLCAAIGGFSLSKRHYFVVALLQRNLSVFTQAKACATEKRFEQKLPKTLFNTNHAVCLLVDKWLCVLMPILNIECVTPNDELLENQQLVAEKTPNQSFVLKICFLIRGLSRFVRCFPLKTSYS